MRGGANLNSKKILVIGGAGYVGSHFTLYSVNSGFQSQCWTISRQGIWLPCEAPTSSRAISMNWVCSRSIFPETHTMLFSILLPAALSGNRVSSPALYYRNNVVTAFNMLEAMRATGHDRLIFSSSCAVYGEPKALPLKEDHPKSPISPYGRTKLAIEWMLEDYQKAYGIRSASLRYFNAAGCEPGQG